MSSLVRDEQPSAFLRLPVEIRLLIYSYLFPEDVLRVDLCTPPRSGAKQLRCSPRPDASILVKRLYARVRLIRHDGVQMLLVCRRTRNEVLSLLSDLTVRFHCDQCFEGFLSNIFCRIRCWCEMDETPRSPISKRGCLRARSRQFSVNAGSVGNLGSRRNGKSAAHRAHLLRTTGS